MKQFKVTVFVDEFVANARQYLLQEYPGEFTEVMFNVPGSTEQQVLRGLLSHIGSQSLQNHGQSDPSHGKIKGLALTEFMATQVGVIDMPDSSDPDIKEQPTVDYEGVETGLSEIPNIAYAVEWPTPKDGEICYYQSAGVVKCVIAKTSREALAAIQKAQKSGHLIEGMQIQTAGKDGKFRASLIQKEKSSRPYVIKILDEAFYKKAYDKCCEDLTNEAIRQSRALEKETLDKLAGRVMDKLKMHWAGLVAMQNVPNGLSNAVFEDSEYSIDEYMVSPNDEVSVPMIEYSGQKLPVNVIPRAMSAYPADYSPSDKMLLFLEDNIVTGPVTVEVTELVVAITYITDLDLLVSSMKGGTK